MAREDANRAPRRPEPRERHALARRRRDDAQRVERAPAAGSSVAELAVLPAAVEAARAARDAEPQVDVARRADARPERALGSSSVDACYTGCPP